MSKETFFVETFFGAKCFVEFEVISKRENRVLVKGWNGYKELARAENGKTYWIVDEEYTDIPEKWKD